MSFKFLHSSARTEHRQTLFEPHVLAQRHQEYDTITIDFFFLLVAAVFYYYYDTPTTPQYLPLSSSQMNTPLPSPPKRRRHKPTVASLVAISPDFQVVLVIVLHILVSCIIDSFGSIH